MSHSNGSPSPRPWVTANFASTWDARISTRSRTPSDFSSPADKARLLQIRAEGDAVLASAATVRADSMTMGLPDPALREARRARGQNPYPLRVIWSNSGRLPTEGKLLSATFSPVLVPSTAHMPSSVREALGARASVHMFPGDHLSPPRVLEWLAEAHGVRTLIFEGGGTLFRLFLEHRCVDELCLTLCPMVFGGSQGISLTGPASEFLPASVHATLIDMEPSGAECFTRWRLRYPARRTPKNPPAAAKSGSSLHPPHAPSPWRPSL